MSDGGVVAEVAGHLIGGEVVQSGGGAVIEVTSPGTGRAIGSVAFADRATLDAAVTAATTAFPSWSAVPSTARARALLKLAAALDANRDELAALITLDNGKTLTDAHGELSRSIEHLEAAATAPALLAGDAVVDILPGLDALLLREAIGVCAVVAPFNFPLMTGLIYWAWALACGNTVVIKPSEQTPYTMLRVAELLPAAGFPAGVVNIVQGGRELVEAICDHPDIASVSLVGSSATAAAVYARASAAGKRVHTAGGARNPLVVMPDADLAATADAIVASAYTMAGQRCLSASILITTGGVHDQLIGLVADRANALVVGPGDAASTQVPPLISRDAVERLTTTVENAASQGACMVVDGRAHVDPDGAYLIGPTLLTQVQPDSELLHSESFGPLVSAVDLPDLESAIELVNASPFGNAASIFTASGAAARRFVTGASVGNVGVNVGVVAPTAQIGFGGRRRSFTGTIHSQGKHAIEFFTDIKSVSTRW